MSPDFRAASAAVRRDIREHHAAELADCDRIREHAVGMFENWTGRGIERTADGLVAAIFARSTDTFTCALRCVRLGYGGQGAMLNRSLFEDMVDGHWIVTDPETAEARYPDHHTHGRMLLADTVASFPDMYAEVEPPEFDPGERKRLDAMFGKYGERSWSGLSLHERVKLIQHHWTTEMDREGLRFMHALAHRENNQTLHVSAQSLGAVAEVDESGRPAFRVGPRPDMVRRTMFGAFWTFTQTVTLVIDHFGFPMSDTERAAMFDASSFHKPDDPDALRF
ncbi:MAG: DUF5677 domain-containing protein [Solirubrobacteraceae bacterium]